MTFFRLLRLPNLIILVVTLYTITQRVIYPPLIAHKIVPALTSKEYLLFLFIALCVGAGGYVYNDIVDQKTDLENNKRLIVGHKITNKIALGTYLFLMIAPLLPMLSLTMELHRPDYLLYYLFVVVILWLYNQFLKKMPLIGNIVVASLCAFAVYMPYILEMEGMVILKQTDLQSYREAFNIIIAFTVFSFLANLIREIIKDIEDIEGDQADGHKTFPIAYSIEKANTLVLAFTVILLVLIIAWTIPFIIDFNISTFLSSLLLILPLGYLIAKIRKATESIHYYNLSQYWKLYFAVGIISLVMMTYS